MFLRLRRKTPITNIEIGVEAVVEGTVIARNELTLRGSETRCVYFDRLTESFEVGPRGRGRKMWVPKNMERKCSGFFVSDGKAQVWVTSNVDGLQVSGGKQEAGMIGKKGRQRYQAQFIQAGDTIRVRGLVTKPKGADPHDGFVLRADKKGRLGILVRSK